MSKNTNELKTGGASGITSICRRVPYGCAFYLFIRAPRTWSVSDLPGLCLHDFAVCSRSALGTAANTDSKLLIYGLFQKG